MSEKIALGFCNNVDYEIVWDAAVLESLVARYRIGADELRIDGEIGTERQLLISILGFMRAGVGGERFVDTSDLLERFAARFDKKITLGGTSVRAAIAMRKLGHKSALHLITRNDHVRRLIPADSPYVCSNDADSAHPHLIAQFNAGDRVSAGDIDIVARQANRLIYHCNADRIALKINEDFSDLITGARVMLVSGFNAMQSEGLLRERLASVNRLLGRLPADATVFLEDGGYYDDSFRQVILEALGDRIDVFSLNEDELRAQLGGGATLREPAEAQAAMAALGKRIPAGCIVLHTRHWALAHGKGASGYAAALKAGVAMATTRFRHGDDWTEAQYRAIEAAAAHPANERFAAAINATPGDSWQCAPVADVEQAGGTTIGLGDAFVGGFLAALAGEAKSLQKVANGRRFR